MGNRSSFSSIKSLVDKFEETAKRFFAGRVEEEELETIKCVILSYSMKLCDAIRMEKDEEVKMKKMKNLFELVARLRMLIPVTELGEKITLPLLREIGVYKILHDLVVERAHLCFGLKGENYGVFSRRLSTVY